MSTSVFITGGTGFLGSYIIKELVQKNYVVRAIRRSGKRPFYIPASIFESVEWIDGDILDVMVLEDAMRGVDAVIHAAAKVSFANNDKNELFKTNIEGTANVVNAALANDVKKFIYVSSVATLGNSVNGAPINESNPWKERLFSTSYAESKYHAEMEVWRATGEGLPAAIVNPSTIIGYGDWDSSSCSIFKTVFKEFPWYTKGVNGFVDVEDVARAIVLLLQTDIQSERFILNGDNTSFYELFNLIADAFGKNRPRWEATPFLGEIAWRGESIKSFFSGKPSILNKQTARIAQSKRYFENNKIRKYLPGFSFTSLSETINKACKSYLDGMIDGQ